MNETTPQPAQRRVTIGRWLAVVAAIGVVALFLYRAIFTSDESTARIDAETQAILWALAQYKTDFGAFPSGDSSAICRVLTTGNNPKNIRYIKLDSVAPDGAFLDPWGTPYKIYFSDDWPLLRSAGPNKQFDASTQRKKADDYFAG